MKHYITRNINTQPYINTLYMITGIFALLLLSNIYPSYFINITIIIALGISLIILYSTYKLSKNMPSPIPILLGLTIGGLSILSSLYLFFNSRSNSTFLDIIQAKYFLILIITVLLYTSLLTIYRLSKDTVTPISVFKQYSTILIIVITSISFLLWFFIKLNISGLHINLLIELITFSLWFVITFLFFKSQKSSPSTIKTSIIIICIHYIIIYIFHLYTKFHTEYTSLMYILYLVILYKIYKVLMNLYTTYNPKDPGHLIDQTEISSFYVNYQMDFFTNISHELKTPVNMIYSSLQMQEFYIENNNLPKVETYTKVIRQNCLRLIRLINNALDLSNLNSNTLSPKLVTFNVVGMIENMIDVMASFIVQKNLSIVFDTNIEEKIIESDPILLQRVILNLISNAVKFSKEKGHIWITLDNYDDFLTIHIKDDGIGIPKHKQGFIFREFAQIDPILTRRSEGCGIGLSLVQGLVKVLGGTISFTSEESVGSEFIVKLNTPSADTTSVTSSHWDSSFIPLDSIEMEFTDVY